MKEWINVLSWEPNPENNNQKVASYRIYVLDGNRLVLLDQVEKNVFTYYHLDVEAKEYWYGLSAVSEAGKESRPVFVYIH